MLRSGASTSRRAATRRPLPSFASQPGNTPQAPASVAAQAASAGHRSVQGRPHLPAPPQAASREPRCRQSQRGSGLQPSRHRRPQRSAQPSGSASSTAASAAQERPHRARRPDRVRRPPGRIRRNRHFDGRMVLHGHRLPSGVPGVSGILRFRHFQGARLVLLTAWPRA